MQFTIGEEVWKQVKDSMWTGVYLGSFHDLSGKLILACQNRHSKMIFFSDPSHLHRIVDTKEFVRY